MGKLEIYRQVFTSFVRLCEEGKQDCSFGLYCAERGVDHRNMRSILKDEYKKLSTISGYKQFRIRNNRNIHLECKQAYEEFKELCMKGGQSGSFKKHYTARGITRNQMQKFQKRNKITLDTIDGYSNTLSRRRYLEVPFENVIFEEAGFLPAESGNVITVKVDGRVAVSFPADTDVEVIARFVARTRKEDRHVGA